MAIKNIKLKNAEGDYLYPYTENLPKASTTTQGAVQLDDTPTAGSANALTSGGAKTALDNKLDASGTAVKATSDANGNVISDTYATKTEVENIETLANTAKSLAEGRVRAVSFAIYSELIEAVNATAKTDYKIGDVFYLRAQNVPDLWVYDVADNSSAYTYSTDEALINDIQTDGFVQVGYFKLSALESAKVDLAGFVPTSRTINGKAMSANIILSASDVGALAAGGTAEKATSDADGNNISQTYAKLADVISFEEM